MVILHLVTPCRSATTAVTMSMSSANLWVRGASLLVPAGPACLCADFDLQFDHLGGGLVTLPGAALLEAYERAAGANAAQHGLLEGR